MAAFRTVSSKASTAWRLPWREKLWFLIFYPLSGVARLAILALPFRVVARFLGVSVGNRTPVLPATENQERAALRICRVGEIVSRNTPWESKCLVQALMNAFLLRCYGIPHVVFIGVGKSENLQDPLKAHAWLQVGQQVTAGRRGHREFTVLSAYVSETLVADSGQQATR
ncbi:lasso peptide biosynthesis B2 protein [Pelagicoccus sp. SDUM812003]|uniref:lasso peptide biosynthesis B2 protein n=1 Tax=Pelagicoccus sp. SDUM812003 TaxID=3041267 RepID=UPI00280EC8D8|nr:lasso peptide biosynthesis B2 protein [Pelagicoccus sp. SDUM812003]MDQ8202352.1 lasso peptide biosynthesis B2 protein [Pelagicoccus sp. SDUM812003]